MGKKQYYQFAKAEEGSGFTDLSTDPLASILAVCIASQQSANFGNHLDVRRTDCPDCGAPGFNGGWGALLFSCGAEIVDGDMSESCGGIYGSRGANIPTPLATPTPTTGDG